MQPLRPAPHGLHASVQQAARLLATACAELLRSQPRGCVGRAGPEVGRGGGVVAAPVQLPPAAVPRLLLVPEQYRAAPWDLLQLYEYSYASAEYLRCADDGASFCFVQSAWGGEENHGSNLPFPLLFGGGFLCC